MKLPRHAIFVRNMNIWVIPGFSCRDLVAVLVKYFENGSERRLVVSSTYLPYDCKDSPPPRELEELVQYCENKNLYLIVVCDSDATSIAGLGTLDLSVSHRSYLRPWREWWIDF